MVDYHGDHVHCDSHCLWQATLQVEEKDTR